MPPATRFDVGLHYVGDLDEFQRLLGGAGVSLAAVQNYPDFQGLPASRFSGLADPDTADVVLEQMDPDCYDTLVFPDFSFPIPASLDLYGDRLAQMFPSEGSAIKAYMRLLREVNEMQRAVAAPKARGSAVADALSMAWKVATSGRLLAKWQGSTLGQFLDAYTNNQQLRAVIGGQNGDYGVPPGEVSILLHCGLALHYFRDGGFYPRGGGQAISDALAAAIERNGGQVHLRRPVRRIVVEDGAAVGVELQSRGPAGTPHPQVRARVVIGAADLGKTLTKLLAPEEVLERQEAEAVAQQVAGFQNADGLFMSCLGVSVTPHDLRDVYGMASANYWCFDDYDFDDAYRLVRSGERLDAFGAYITSASLKDPHVAHSPDGTSNVEVLTVCSTDPQHWGLTHEEAYGPGAKYRRNQAYLDAKARLQDGMLARLDQQFPGLSSKAVFTESTTPFSHHRFTHGGTAYGLAATPQQFMKKRPGVTAPVDRLLMCGHSTRSGHGIVGAMMGGAKAASVARKVLGVGAK